MSDFWLDVYMVASMIGLLFSVVFFISSLNPLGSFGKFFYSVSCVMFFIFLISKGVNEFNQIEQAQEYEILHEIPVDTQGNVDTITYQLDDSTLKILNLNEHFGRKFTNETIIIKRIKAGTYAGWKVGTGKRLIFEVEK